jgi:AraC-like DNA-binding protein
MRENDARRRSRVAPRTPIAFMTRLSYLRFINTERTELPVRKRLRSRGVPTALQDHEVVCTREIREAVSAVSTLLGHSTLRLDPNVREDFQVTLNAVRFLDVTMAYLDFRAPVRLQVDDGADIFAIHQTTHDSATVGIDGEERELSAFAGLICNPGDRHAIRLGADCPQLIIRIERDAIERQLTRMLGRSLDRPIEFERTFDLIGDEAVRWLGAIQLLSSEIISQRSLLQKGLGAAALEELLISTLLYIQPSNYSELIRNPHLTTGRTAVRRSLQYVEEHLAEPITMDDLARHACASVRAIQMGFREDLDTTPISYIRDRRLDKVRAALMEAIPADRVTVAAVAQRWGFQNAGTFAVRYRQRFGESPSETLRR